MNFNNYDEPSLETSYKNIFEMIEKLMPDIFWWLDRKTKTIDFLSDGLSNFNVERRMHNFPESIINRGIIVDDDLSTVELIKDAIKHNKELSFELQLNSKDNKLSWYKIQYHIIETKNVSAIFGLLININEIKNYEYLSKFDTLTGCLNKITTEKNITSTLNHSYYTDIHALFVVDIDSLKSINDTFGHPFGDVVIAEIGCRLRNIVREDDIVGRIGGDEFIVFVKTLKNAHEIIGQAERILNVLNCTVCKGDIHCHVSASIGVVVSTTNVDTFQELYKKADGAMYESKQQGKNRYSIFTDDMI